MDMYASIMSAAQQKQIALPITARKDMIAGRIAQAKKQWQALDYAPQGCSVAKYEIFRQKYETSGQKNQNLYILRIQKMHVKS
jgi:uncharacterized protein (DUF3084 family)